MVGLVREALYRVRGTNNLFTRNLDEFPSSPGTVRLPEGVDTQVGPSKFFPLGPTSESVGRYEVSKSTADTRRRVSNVEGAE